MFIKDQIRILLNQEGLSQEKLARELGVSFATLNSWVNGRSQPRAVAFQKIHERYLKITGQSTLSRSELDLKMKVLLSRQRDLPHPLRLILKRPDLLEQFVLSLTYNSNKIEGSTLTEDETATVLFDNRTLPDKTLVEQLEAKNHQTALNYMFRTLQESPVDEAWILKIHSILMNGIRDDAGLYRNHNVRIVGSFVPTANHLKVPDLMRDLIKKMGENHQNIFEYCSQIHAGFEKIHPFSDGNGRVGRIMLNAFLLKAKFPPALIQNDKKRLYYTYLQKAQLDEDFSLLEDFIMDAVLEAYPLLKEE